MDLTKIQKQLCNRLQDGLAVCERPFEELAKTINTNKEVVLQETIGLKELGVIRRISALINYRALGMTGTLVAAHIPEENMKEITEAVNTLEDVSHNYIRKHYYNLWFTLQGGTEGQIKVTLSKLSGRFGIDFHSLPVERVFKLDVRFDAESEGELMVQEFQPVPEEGIVELNEGQKLILAKLQTDLEITARPFDLLCGEDLEIKDVLRIMQELVDNGVIRRIAAVVDHRKLGFTANVLFVSEVPRDRIIRAGEELARFKVVSHCYQRGTFEGWPYNLFAMMHGKSFGDIQRVIDRFIEAEKIDPYELLPTKAELKKQPVKYQF